jgi:hypothetical protein
MWRSTVWGEMPRERAIYASLADSPMQTFIFLVCNYFGNCIPMWFRPGRADQQALQLQHKFRTPMMAGQSECAS